MLKMGFCRNVAGLRQCVEGLVEKRLDLYRVGQGKAVQYRSRFITDLEHDFVQFAVFLRKAVVAPFMCEAACAWNKRQRSPGQPDDVSIANIDGGQQQPIATFPPTLGDRKSTRLNSSHSCASRMPSS